MPPPDATISSTTVPLPRHYQDTFRHCGFACATMALDWRKSGLKYQPFGPAPGPNGTQTGDLSQLMMHQHVRGEGIWICSPKELRALCNEQAALPSSGVKAWEIEQPAEEITQQVLEFIFHRKRPSAVALAYSGKKKTHWVMVTGATQTSGETLGIFLADPWVPDGNFAYQCHPKCYEAGDGLESSSSEAGKNHFLHNRGESCSCPQWHPGPPGSSPPVMEDVWKACYNLPDFTELVSWGAIGSKCHAVVFARKGEIKIGLNAHAVWEPKPTDPVERVMLPAALLSSSQGSDWRPFLQPLGLADTSVQEWDNLLNVAGAVSAAVLDADSNEELIVFLPVPPLGTVRLGLRFHKSGCILGAARLRNWPDLQIPADVAADFLANGAVWCQNSSLNLDLTGITVDAAPALHWRECRQSAVSWWPFYVLTITPPPAANGTAVKPYKLYVDLANRVYLSLTDQETAGA